MSAPSVVALIAAYNEEDVIAECVGELIAQGVGVYFLDDGSTDGTLREVEQFRGQGLVGVEALRPPTPPEGSTYRWSEILARKQTLARTLDAEWFIHHDADEFRESPWPGRSLAEAIAAVDTLGFNAVDHAVFDFWPTHDRLEKGQSVRAALTRCAPGAPHNARQVRAWKKHPEAELVSSGGHEVKFPGRSVFPLRFIVRHYPLRGQRHAERKVLRERVPRFDPAEKALGWHVQYEGLGPSGFLRSEDELVPWDGEAVRLRLAIENRDAEAAQAAHHRAVAEARAEGERQERELEHARAHLHRAEAALAAAHAEGARLRERLAAAEEAERVRAAQAAAAQASADAAEARARAAQASAEATGRELAEVYASASWKVTAPARRALKRLRGY